ncbi:hypothetical protein D3C71_1300170 [compost metagenome]
MGKRLEKLRGMTVKVGIQKGSTDDKGSLIATYAAHNNFGTKNAMGGVLIPARPFMVFSAKGIQQWMNSAEFTEAVFKMNVGKMTPSQVAHLIGTRSTQITKENILKSDQYIENSKPTLERKRAKKQGDKPLLASRSMYKAVRYIIVKG